MTRVLSELLGAHEPMFRRGLARLEAASGHDSTDIRLSAEIERAAKNKLRQLSLDPHDTTGEELYNVLQSKVITDSALLTTKLTSRLGISTSSKLVAKVIEELPLSKSCFSLKTAAGKRLLKQLPPKKSMKMLGYRSYDSMIRREPLIAVFAAAWLLEPLSWRKAMLEAYRRLKPSDFELRQLSVIAPDPDRWQNVSASVIESKKNTIVGLKEFGAIVLLPFPRDEPPGAFLAVLLLSLHELNEVRASSTYLKLCQVKPDFGNYVRMVVAEEPALGVDFLNGAMPWQVIQRYYARYVGRERPELFNPHVQQDDLSWHSIEKALAHIDPRLKFWQHTASTGILDRHKPVSMNVIDAALNLCNTLPYEQRIVHYFQHSLWHELVIRYMHHQAIERTVLNRLDTQLVEETQLLYS